MTWSRRMFPITTLVVLAIIGGLFWGADWVGSVMRAVAEGHRIEVRTAVLRSQARQRPPRIVVFGDSLVEMAVIGDLCGEPTLAAGVWGAKIEDLAKFAPKVLEAADPVRIVAAIGINDTAREGATDPDVFIATYRALIAQWRAAGIAVDIATLAPVTREGKLGERHFDPARRKGLDERIRALAAEVPVRVVPFDGLPKTETGSLPPAFSDDGAHLTAEGYRAWRSTLETAVCAVP
jgi:lysophospholipase L1-like esterase